MTEPAVKKIKSFAEYRQAPSLGVVLTEELNDYQKKKVDRMPEMGVGAAKEHDRVFGPGNDKIIIPFHGPDQKITTHNHKSVLAPAQLRVTSNILGHLQSHGYFTKDYRAGLVHHQNTPKRDIKISKALETIGSADEPSPHLNKEGGVMTWKQSYDADPARQSKSANKQIVFTKNRYDVAGVSTDRKGWTSCMEMDSGPNVKDGGINQHKLPDDLYTGTIAAYVTHHGDDDVKHPIARQALKQFMNENHIIYRPESTSYGAFQPEAGDAISKWAEEKYPSNPGVYVKNPSLYNDDGRAIKIEKVADYSGSDIEDAHRHIRQTLRTAHDAGYQSAMDAMHKHDDDSALTDHYENMETLTTKMHDMLPEHHKIHIATHALLDGADEDNDDFAGKTMDDDVDPDHIDASHFVKHWAANHTRDITDHINHEYSSEDALKLHSEIHNRISKTNSDAVVDNHQSLKHIHATLINHVMTGDNQQHKDAVLHDIMDSAGTHEQHGYYENMLQNQNTVFDHTHPAEHTVNPRVIHSMLKDEDKISMFPQNNWKHDPSTALHIGKHADDKLASHLMFGDHRNTFSQTIRHGNIGKYGLGDDRTEDFMHGLNQNPNGEAIQHHITSHMVLDGGYNPEQQTRLPIENEREMRHYTKQVLSVPTETNRGRIDTTKTYTIPRVMHDMTADATDSADEVDRFADVALHTKFKSVLDKLKNRHDTQIPAIQNAVRDNYHVLHEGVQAKSLSEFMLKAKYQKEISK